MSKEAYDGANEIYQRAKGTCKASRLSFLAALSRAAAAEFPSSALPGRCVWFPLKKTSKCLQLYRFYSCACGNTHVDEFAEAQQDGPGPGAQVRAKAEGPGVYKRVAHTGTSHPTHASTVDPGSATGSQHLLGATWFYVVEADGDEGIYLRICVLSQSPGAPNRSDRLV